MRATHINHQLALTHEGTTGTTASTRPPLRTPTSTTRSVARQTQLCHDEATIPTYTGRRRSEERACAGLRAPSRCSAS